MYSLVHILVVALIPAICGYYAAAHIGWTIGAGDAIRLTQESAMIMSVAMYLALITGVFAKSGHGPIFHSLGPQPKKRKGGR